MSTDRPGLPFLFGIYGIDPTEETIHFLKETGASGIVLLRRNVEDSAQVTRLIHKLESEVGHELIIAIDHEGGLVTRFSDRVTSFPGNMALGKTGNADLAHEVGQWMARELRTMGINVNLAPVLDVVGTEFNPSITVRSYGSTARLASDLGTAFIRGLQEEGMLAVAKHFPGMGAAAEDPHHTIGSVELAARSLKATHLPPFEAAIQAGVACIMTSHIKYPHLDKSSGIATLSRKIVTDLLRDSLGFEGVIITDDLSMGAVTESGGMREMTVAAAQAGHDLFIVAHDPKEQRAAFEEYRAACHDGRLNPLEVAASRKRVEALMETIHKAKPAGKPNPGSSERVSEMIAWEAVRVVRDPEGVVPVSPGSKVGLIVPRLVDMSSRYVIDAELHQMDSFVRSWLREAKKEADVREIPIDVPAAEMDDLLAWAKEKDVVAHFCFDAMRVPGQKRMLAALELIDSSIAVLVFHPWDEKLVPKKTTVVQTYGFRTVQMEAALDMIFHGR